MSIHCFVTIHDSQLIKECEESKRFNGIPHTYLFVGPREVEFDESIDVIVARNYSPNYEHLPQFYDFTGWFVLGKHNLITSDYVVFLQYDHLLTNPEIATTTIDALKDNDVISYVGGSSAFWWLAIEGFGETQSSGLVNCGMTADAAHRYAPTSDWLTTQGMAWRSEHFKNMILWFEPAFESFKEHIFAGHLAERMIQIYVSSNQLRHAIVPNQVFHESLDCHGTRDLTFGAMDSYTQKVSTFGK
jgi:hypothetical protein